MALKRAGKNLGGESETVLSHLGLPRNWNRREERKGPFSGAELSFPRALLCCALCFDQRKLYLCLSGNSLKQSLINDVMFAWSSERPSLSSDRYLPHMCQLNSVKDKYLRTKAAGWSGQEERRRGSGQRDQQDDLRETRNCFFLARGGEMRLWHNLWEAYAMLWPCPMDATGRPFQGEKENNRFWLKGFASRSRRQAVSCSGQLRL